MAIINPKPTTHVPLDNVKLNTVQWDAEAHRVFEVDSTGTSYDDLSGLLYLRVGAGSKVENRE